MNLRRLWRFIKGTRVTQSGYYTATDGWGGPLINCRRRSVRVCADSSVCSYVRDNKYETKYRLIYGLKNKWSLVMGYGEDPQLSKPSRKPNLQEYERSDYVDNPHHALVV